MLRTISNARGIVNTNSPCTRLYWKDNRVKCEIALSKGKQEHDKRKIIAERDWNRQKQRVLRTDHR